MLLLLLVAALLLGATSEARAGEGASPLLLTTSASEALLDRGRTALLAFRLAEADSLFRLLSARPDGVAAGRLYRATAALWRALARDEAAAFERFRERLAEAEQTVAGLPPSAARAYLEGELSLLEGMAAAKEGHHVRAAWALRSAYLRYGRALEADADQVDAYRGLGLLHLAIGTLPASYRALLRILGFEGSVEEGLAELRLAADSSRHGREEATMWYAAAQALLDFDERSAIDAASRLYERDSESHLYAYLYGFLLLEGRRADGAEAVLRRAAALGARPGYVAIAYVEAYLGDALFLQNRFGEAERWYRSYLLRHTGPALKAQTTFRLGLALELQGRREEALPYYRRVAAARSLDADEVAVRQAEARLAAPLAPPERRLLLAQNAFDAGAYDRAEGSLRDLLEDSTLAPLARTEASYRLGRVLHVTGRYGEALRWYRAAASRPVDPRAKWSPWSQLYIAEILASRGDRAGAREAYRKALAFRTPFDYHQGLEQRAKAALERLGS